MHESIIDKAEQSKFEVCLSFHATFSIFARQWVIWSHTQSVFKDILKCRKVLIHIQLCTEGYWKQISQLQGREAEPQPQPREEWLITHPGLIKAAFPTSDTGWISEGNSLTCLIKYDRANHRYSSYFPIQNYWAPPPPEVNYPQSVQSVHCLMRPQISNAVLFCENTQDGN